jgi:hypothetical protein
MEDETACGRDFGCEDCWPSEPEAAWGARRRLTCEEELIDESHCHVVILACPRCAQRFISVFTETIDWTEGDDPQYWTVMPISQAEAADLVRQRDSLPEAAIDALGPGRRSLRRDRPKAEPPRTFWATGVWVGFHD